MGELGKRIRQMLSEKGMSQADLARAVGVKQQTISYICAPDSPSTTSRYAAKIAGALGVNPMWLQTGQGDMHDPVVRIEHAGVELSLKRVPLRNGDEEPSSAALSLMTDANVSKAAFAIEIDNDSMAPVFHSGDRVIVDPIISPEPGDYVLAKRNGITLFRKFRCRGGNTFELVPMNSDWPTLVMEHSDAQILGVMVEHRIYRRRK